MTIEELRAIVNYVETDPKNSVIVNVKLSNGTNTRVRIKSFGTYSDALVLNAKE